ncbi:hypothetical protein DFJ68_0449 [Terracoccus luteus]|uniref:Uncharacterized protein n=1 Tax=Terracoccus luteus TaxID=53356 RepID=A0A495XZ72_9MICO|nr:hypothetical protein [Terracoccus luteus]RKT77038.1 hypothetical protein DFJ68_0449 [Terracoccus luteus]
MSGEMINVDAPVDAVRDLLVELRPRRLQAVRWGWEMSFGDLRFALVGDAAPDAGTDVSVQDRSRSDRHLAWEIYDHLCRRTDAALWLMDDGGLIAAARWGAGHTDGPVAEDSPLTRTGYPPGH